MQLKNILHASVFVRVRASASACVRVHLRACVYTQKIKRPDASRRKRSLRPDMSFVQDVLYSSSQ